MKKILLIVLTLYHRFVSPLVWQALGIKTLCRYNQSCSAYSIEVIEKYGAIKGLLLSLKRLLSCQPFIKPYVSNI